MSLRDAILEANSTPGPDTINLPAGTFRLSLAGTAEDAAHTGDLDITESVTIFGAGVGETRIEAQRIDRVLHVLNDPESDNVDQQNPDVRIFGTTLSGGLEDLGGGLLNQGGTVRLISSRIEHNEAISNGGAFFNDVHEAQRKGLVLLSNSPVSHNTTAGINREETLENAGRMLLNAAEEAVDAVDSFFGDLSDTFEKSMSSFDFPIIGDQITDALAPVLDTFQTMRSEVRDFLEEVLDKAHDVELPSVPELIQNALFLALGGQFAKQGNDFIAEPIQELFAGIGINVPKFSLNILKDGPDLGAGINPEDIVFEIGSDDHGTMWAEFKFNLGQQLTVDLPHFDLGVGDVAKFLTGPAGEDLGPLFDRMFSIFGFNISSTQGIRFDIKWNMRTGIGLSELASQSVYLLSGATKNGLPDGEEVEELEFQIEVSGVPTDEGSPNLQGQANLGLISGKVTDGTPPDIKIFSGAGLGITNSFDGEFEVIIDGDDVHHISLDTGPVGLPIPALLLALNGKLIEEFQTPLPPLSFTLDFSAIDTFFNADATSLPSLVLIARDPSISTLEIRGAEGLGFEPVQYEDRRGRTLGFGNNTASVVAPDGKTQRLLAALPAPADGVLFDNPSFDLLIGGTRVIEGGVEVTRGAVKVPIYFEEILARDQLTPLDSLRIKLEETIQTLVGTSTNLPVSTITVDIVPGPDGDRFVLVSHPDPNQSGSSPPLITVRNQTDERSSVKLAATLNIRNPDDVPSLRDDFPNDQRFFNRLTIPKITQYANDLTQVFEPSVKGKARIRLHVNMSADNFVGEVEQTLGIAPGTVGLPDVDYDFVMDVDWDIKNAVKLAYQLLTGQVNPRDLINLDTLLGEIYQVSKFQFANVELDMRHFFQTIVSGVAEGFHKILDPIVGFVGKSAHDAASLLNKRLPVISDVLDENISLRTILAQAGFDDEIDAAINGFLSGVDVLSALPDRIADYLDSDEFRNQVDSRGKFHFGGAELIFDPSSPFFFPATRLILPTDLSYAIQSASELGPLNFFRGFVVPDTFQGLPLFAGMTLDLVQPQNMMNFLLGNPINIISWGPPKSNIEGLAEFGFDFRDLSFDVSSFAGQYLNVRLAYDSTGFERMVRTLSSGKLPDFRDILAGLFIQNNPGAPEVGRTFRFEGSGSVDLGSFEAEAHVLISSNSNPDNPATVGLEIRDPNHDGKLRLDEIINITNNFKNPENLFTIVDLVFDVKVEIGGSASISIETPFGDIDESIDIGLPIGESISVVDLLGNLFKFGQPAPPPSPVLADILVENGKRILRVNAGPHAAARMYGDINDEDTGAVVTGVTSGNRILLSGYGVSNQVYTGPFDKILVIGSRQNDVLTFSGVTSVPVEIRGDYGNDQLTGGTLNDVIDGGPGNDILTGNAGADSITGGSGVDQVFAGLGNDTVDLRRNSGGAFADSQGGNDLIIGSRFADTLQASGTGNVKIEGGRGNDQISGGSGNDVLIGGDGDDTINGGAGHDNLIGGRGADSLTGQFGQDRLFGAEGEDTIHADTSDSNADGGSGRDHLIFEIDSASGDTLTGSAYIVQSGAQVTYANTELIEIQLGQGADHLTIDGVRNELLVKAGDGEDEITIESLMAEGNLLLDGGDDVLTILNNQSMVSVLGGSGVDQLIVDHSASNESATGTVSATTVAGFQNADVVYGSDVDRVRLLLGTGDDQVTVASSRQDALTEIHTGGGDDRTLVHSAAGAVSINGDAGDDVLSLLVNVAAASLNHPFSQLGFAVESLQVDQRNNVNTIHWSLENREIFGAAVSGGTKTKLVDAVGAARVQFLTNAGHSEELRIVDSVATSKFIQINNDLAAITRFSDALSPLTVNHIPTTELVSEITGLNGTIRNVVYSPDGRFVYVKSQTPSGGNSYLNQLVTFMVDSETGDLIQTQIVDTPDDTGLTNLTNQIHTDLIISADGTRLYEARLNSVSVYLRDTDSGRLFHWNNVSVSGQIASLALNSDENVLLALRAGTNIVQSILINANGSLTLGNSSTMPGAGAVGLDIAFAGNSMDAYISGTTSALGGRIWRVIANSTTGITSCTDVAPSAGANSIPAGVIGFNPQGDRFYLFSDNQYGGDKLPDTYARNTSNGTISFIDSFSTEFVTDRANTGIVFDATGSKFYLTVLAGTSGSGGSVREFLLNTAGDRAITAADGRIPGLAGTEGRVALRPDQNELLLGMSTAELHRYKMHVLNVAAPGQLYHTYRNGEQTFQTIETLDSFVVAPNGKDAFGINTEHSAVIRYLRDNSTGQLTQAAVYFDNVNGLNTIEGVAGVASARGAYGDLIIFVAPGEKRVSVYAHNPNNGDLELVDVDIVNDLTGEIRSVTTSPDGSFLLVATDQKILAFSIAPDAVLNRIQSNDPSFSFGVRDIAASSDSKDLYVTSDAGELRHFRVEEGTIQLSETLTLANADKVELSHDGRSLYVTRPAVDSIAVFSRSLTTGMLTLEQTVVNGNGGVTGLNDIRDLIISTSDTAVFVSSASDNTIVAFRRDSSTGRLTFRQRIRNLSGGVTDLARPTMLTLSHDGLLLHAITVGNGSSPSSVVQFAVLPEPPADTLAQYSVGWTADVSSVSLTTGSGNDSVTVGNSSVPLVINTLSGIDDVVLQNTSNLDVTVNLGSDDDRVDIRSRGQNSDINVAAGQGRDIMRIGHIAANSLATFHGDDGSDTFRVVGSKVLSPISLFGDSQEQGGGDLFQLDPQGFTTTPSSLSAGSSSVRVNAPNSQLTSYFDMEMAQIIAPPIPVLTAPSIDEGQSVTLSAAGTIIPFGGAATYAWDINGDGIFEEFTGEEITLSWNDLRRFGLGDSGTYMVSVRATETAEASSDTSETLSIGNVAPTVLATVPASIVAGENLVIQPGVSDPGNDRIVRWRINWGDGSPVQTVNAVAPILRHIYDASSTGTKTIVLEAFDEDGGPYTKSISINVLAPPDVTGGSRINEGSIYLLNLENTGDAIIDSWAIQWGDGTESTAAGTATQANHIFRNEGVYTIRVVAIQNSPGNRFLATPLPITVTNVAPVLTSVVNSGPVNQGTSVRISAVATDAGVDDQLTWEMDLNNDGFFETTSSDGEANVVFPIPGTYIVSVRVRDDSNSVSLAQSTSATVLNVAPTIEDFVILTESPRQGEASLFQVFANDLGGLSDRLEYEFDFDDDGFFERVSSTSIVQKVFTENGEFLVRVRVRDASGAVATTSRSVTVANVAPTIISAIAVDAGGASNLLEGHPVLITVVATDLFAASPMLYEYDLNNDGVFEASNSTGEIQHTFPDEGAIVRLKVTDTDAGVDTLTFQLNVANELPTISASVPNVVVLGEAFQLSAGQVQDAGADTLSNFTIDWGDGTQNEYTSPQNASHTYSNLSSPGVRRVRILLKDEDGTHVGFEKLVTVRSRPSSLSLSGTEISEGLPAGSLVGSLSAIDADPGDFQTFELVAGPGDAGNAAFRISNNVLTTSKLLDYEVQSSYSVRVRATDQFGLSTEKSFVIHVKNQLDTSVLPERYVFTYSASGVTVVHSLNGGVATSLGVFPLNVVITLDGLAANDSVRVVGTSGNDVFVVNSTGLTIRGSRLILNGPASRTLAGGTGDDSYLFDADDVLGLYRLEESASGGGTDRLNFASTSADLIVNLGNAGTQTVHSTNLSLHLGSATAFEILIGGSGNDVLTGNSLPNRIAGGNGHDRLTGSGGDDVIYGGLGDDTYIFGDATSAELDQVVESLGQGTDLLSFTTLTSALTLSLSDAMVQSIHTNRTLQLLTASGFENVSGGPGDDVLTGNDSANFLRGNGGNDRLTGAAGDDSLSGGTGDDTYVFGNVGGGEADRVLENSGEGNDTLRFSSVTDDIILSLRSMAVQSVHLKRTLQLSSGSAIENAIGGSGHDTLTGNGLNNVLTGLAGNDRLSGGLGGDTLVGGLDNDTYVFDVAAVTESDAVTENAGQGVDTLDFSAMLNSIVVNIGIRTPQTIDALRTLTLSTASGLDNVLGGSGDDILWGGVGANELTGNGGNDILIGQAGNDRLYGNSGRDLLIGGLGRDELDGGSDDDILIAGRTSSDNLLNKLVDLRSAWIGAGDYATRVSNLRSPVGTSDASLKAKVNVVTDAGEDDILTGAADLDWYFSALNDSITDLFAGELTDVL